VHLHDILRLQFGRQFKKSFHRSVKGLFSGQHLYFHATAASKSARVNVVGTDFLRAWGLQLKLFLS
jgi:hypothetical protein